ncbi:MAG: hypothetical protein KatS3mg101_0512 [Patescibacteria group bacterium]|nr:MAG: hypothetical protein KatS3mg101_0512 [Patescibacteria group bacterium]
MRKIIIFILLVFVSTSQSVFPLVMGGVEKAESVGAYNGGTLPLRPVGRWVTNCDPPQVLHISWTTELKLKNGLYKVVADFRKGRRPDLKLKEALGGSVVAFKIMYEGDTTAWLEVIDGKLVGTRSFKNSKAVTSYPGGYIALERDINSWGIDWVALHEELEKAADEIMEGIDLEKFCPPLPRKKNNWGELVG